MRRVCILLLSTCSTHWTFSVLTNFNKSALERFFEEKFHKRVKFQQKFVKNSSNFNSYQKKLLKLWQIINIRKTRENVKCQKIEKIVKFCNSKLKNRKFVKNAGYQKIISIYVHFQSIYEKVQCAPCYDSKTQRYHFLATNDNSLFQKIAKNCFKFGLCSYTNQLQWHRLLPLFGTFY